MFSSNVPTFMYPNRNKEVSLFCVPLNVSTLTGTHPLHIHRNALYIQENIIWSSENAAKQKETRGGIRLPAKLEMLTGNELSSISYRFSSFHYFIVFLYFSNTSRTMKIIQSMKMKWYTLNSMLSDTILCLIVFQGF